MQFELSGERGWREKLTHEELCVVAEWTSWFGKRYPIVGYLKEEYEDAEEFSKQVKKNAWATFYLFLIFKI